MATKKMFILKVEPPKVVSKDIYLVTPDGDKIRYTANGFEFFGVDGDGEETEGEPLTFADWTDMDNACSSDAVGEVHQFLVGLAELFKKTMDQKKVDKR